MSLFKNSHTVRCRCRYSKTRNMPRPQHTVRAARTSVEMAAVMNAKLRCATAMEASSRSMPGSSKNGSVYGSSAVPRSASFRAAMSRLRLYHPVPRDRHGAAIAGSAPFTPLATLRVVSGKLCVTRAFAGDVFWTPKVA